MTAIFGDDENKDKEKEDGADESSKVKSPEKQKAATTVYDIGPDEDREFEAVTSTPVGSATRGRGRGRGRSPGRGGRGRGRGGGDSVTKVNCSSRLFLILHIIMQCCSDIVTTSEPGQMVAITLFIL